MCVKKTIATSGMPVVATPQVLVTDEYRAIYIYKNNLKIMILKRGVGINHCYKK